MKSKPVISYNLIIRSQIEDSAVAQAMIVRYLLETPSAGQRCVFIDLEALLAILHFELIDVQNQIVPSDQAKENC